MRKVIFLMACLIFPTNICFADNTEDKSITLEKLRSRIDSLRFSLSFSHDEKNELLQQLCESEIAIGKINHALALLEETLSRQHADLEKLQKDKAKNKAILASQYKMLSQQIRNTYITGRQGYLKILLNQQEPSEIGRSLVYSDYFNQARIKQISSIDITLSELAEMESTISEKTRQLDDLKTRHDSKKQSLEQQRQSRQNILVKLEADITDKEQLLSRLLEDEKELGDLLSSIQTSLSDYLIEKPNIKSFSSLKGALPLPSHGRIGSHFGQYRVGKLKWQGIVFEIDEGQDVKAIYDGRVVFADWLRGFGLLMILDHGSGYMSLYGYNQDLYHSVGDDVKMGEVIATTGNSGGHASSGLYFEIRHNGQPADPELWCKTAQR